MAEQIIIAIGREFGSGGHEIAEKLSELYGIMIRISCRTLQRLRMLMWQAMRNMMKFLKR